MGISHAAQSSKGNVMALSLTTTLAPRITFGWLDSDGLPRMLDCTPEQVNATARNLVRAADNGWASGIEARDRFGADVTFGIPAFAAAL